MPPPRREDNMINIYIIQNGKKVKYTTTYSDYRGIYLEEIRERYGNIEVIIERRTRI